MVCLVINGKLFPGAEELISKIQLLCPGPLSFHLNRNREKTNVILGNHTRHLFGPQWIEDVLCGIKIRLSPQSFYQVNRQAAQLLYGVALEYAAPTAQDTLLDLYCGAGAIGLFFAAHVKDVVGIEILPGAVKDAVQNARINNIGNATFICESAAGAANQLRELGHRPSIAVVDPPRKGLDKETIEHLAGMFPEKIVYISCNSATLARDCVLFAEKGYAVRRGRAVDLFPRTAHVECVVLLERTT